MQRKSLVIARRLFRAKKYPEVIKILEPQILKYRESFAYYFLLGASCLYVKDFGGALSYLRRANQIKDDDISTLLGLAVIYFKKMDTEEAIKYWLRVLELDTQNKIARRGLDLVRGKEANEDVISSLLDSGKIVSLFPKSQFRISLVLPLIFVGILCLGIAFYLIYPYIPSLFPAKRVEIDDITLFSEVMPLIEYNKEEPYMLTEREVQEIFKQAKEYFYQYKDNKALVLLNKLIHSNASIVVKQKSRLLKGFAIKPDFSDFHDSYSFYTVKKEPLLYEDVYVLWKGKITNLKVSEDKITFQFMVGYHDEKELQGIVPVELDFGANIKNGDALELLGQVVIRDNYIILKCISWRRIHPD